jgi:hypothetical protein
MAVQNLCEGNIDENKNIRVSITRDTRIKSTNVNINYKNKSYSLSSEVLQSNLPLTTNIFEPKHEAEFIKFAPAIRFLLSNIEPRAEFIFSLAQFCISNFIAKAKIPIFLDDVFLYRNHPVRLEGFKDFSSLCRVLCVSIEDILRTWPCAVADLDGIYELGQEPDPRIRGATELINFINLNSIYQNLFILQ